MAEANIIEFTADLQQFAKDIGMALALAIRKVALDLLARLVFLTPKDTGRAAGSWILSLDTPSSDMLPEGDYHGYTGNQTEAGQVLAALVVDPFHVVWLVNNLPYIEPLNNGHSTQAPAGFVEIAVAEVEATLEGTVRA